jgi:O-acetyl-ADP-ribose deacetylase (regulator of RNase III)
MPLKAIRADITTLDVDAIVNAANEALAMGGGVCGAIFRAAGVEALAAACRAVAPCPTGEARITPGFALKARHVIHAVGPVWRGGTQGEAALLAACYRASLALLRAAGGRSIAFPAISTGIFGYPLDQATRIAVATVREECAAHGELDVTFACFDERTLDTYRKELGA